MNAFDEWYSDASRRKAEDSFVIGLINDETLKLLGASGSSDLLISNATVLKQQLNHPDVVASDYQRVQRMLIAAEMRSDRDKHFALIEDGDRSWLAVIKVTQSGKAVWLQSLRRTNQRDIERLRGRSRLVRK